MTKFFSHSPDSGFILHDSLQLATEAARNELDQYRANAGDTGEWAREVEHVCYGSILGQTLGTEDPSQLDAYGEPCVDFSLDGQTIDECRAAFEDFMMRDSNVPTRFGWL